MTPSTISQLIQHHEEQVEGYTVLAALSEAAGEATKTAEHLAMREKHQRWADQLREFATTLIDNFDLLTSPFGARALFIQPLNPSAARHA